ncbi:MAG: hypothetical protein WBO46_21665 [Caldilineaceae bacterium]
MIKEQIIENIRAAYSQLISKDGYLLRADANERSITHKLAEYLQLYFPEWHVDCEYNRNGLDVKKLDTFKRSIKSDDTNAVSVYPDIIIHHRDTKDNLVVIEAKKNSYSGEDHDEEKLRAYKNDLQYKFAFKITFPVGDTYENSIDASGNIKEII